MEHQVKPLCETPKGCPLPPVSNAVARALELNDRLCRLNGYQIIQEMQTQEADINSTWADPSKKVQDLNNLIPKYRELFQEMRDGETVIISQQEADRAYLAAEQQIREEIKAVADEMAVKETATVSLAEEIISLETKTKMLNQQMSELDKIIRAIPETKTIDVSLNIQGLENLQQVTAAMGMPTATEVPTYNDNGPNNFVEGAYWVDGKFAGFARIRDEKDPRASGGPVLPYNSYLVGERGPEIIRMGSMGGTVIPNEKIGGGNVNLGGVKVEVYVNGGGDPQKIGTAVVDELARQLLPKLRKYAGRTF